MHKLLAVPLVALAVVLTGCPGGPSTTTDGSVNTDTVALTVSTLGSGTLSSAPAGIDCGSACTAQFSKGSSVTLTAAPGSGAVVKSWGGDCTGSSGNTCTLTMDGAKTASVEFATGMQTVTVTLAGSGGGEVVSTPAGIDCGNGHSLCSAAFTNGSSVSFAVTPATGSTFAGWSGACTGTAPCSVTVSAATALTATFTATPVTLTVTTSGAGGGTVTSAPAGINCGATCTHDFNYGAMVTLTAAPNGTSDFIGWSGACTGTGTCTVTLTQARSVNAEFQPQGPSLTVTRAGAGVGTVTSAPAGINCGATCSARFPTSTSVTLTAAASAGSTFTGWSGGGCSGTGACVVTLAADTTVTATFAVEQFALTVTKAGTGAGTVTSAPAGVACGPTCSASFDTGSVVTLTAAEAAGSTFAGWSGGGCTGTGTCVVTVTAATSVTATFTINQYTLTVARAGTGTGTVTSAPAGINCGVDCTEPYNAGTVVTLTAAAAGGSAFAGWSGGGCTGTGTCVVTMTAATTVTATFNTAHTLTLVRAGTGTGSVTSSPGGISCGADCTEPYGAGTVVSLTAAAASGSTFAGWSGGGCSGTGACVVTVNAATAVTATFNLQTFTLTVGKAGSGTGTVTSSPAGINCGSTCTGTFASGTVVTLTATPAGGSGLTGWSGSGCSGTGTCVVTVTADSVVVATFAAQFTLTIAKTGLFAANAVVTSTPAGINCGAVCSGTFPGGTSVTLSTTVAGSKFNGWSGGGCSGTGTCTFTGSADTTITASYRAVKVAISVNASSCLRNPSEAGERLRVLLAARGHTPTFNAAAELDSAAEINAFDVIVIGGPGNPCGGVDESAYDSVIDAYIRTNGGGVVASGWLLYNGIAGPNLVNDLPTVANMSYLTGTQSVATVSTLFATGLAGFSSGEWVPTGGGAKAGATTVLTVAGNSVGAAWNLGNGRTVFLGPMYVEAYTSYQNENLLDNSQPDATELFLRAIEWAAKAR